jgi:hypothetical protein
MTTIIDEWSSVKTPPRRDSRVAAKRKNRSDVDEAIPRRGRIDFLCCFAAWMGREWGRLMEILDSVAATAEFDRRAKEAATGVAEVGKLTVRRGNPGVDAVNDWIADMMSIYRVITGKEPATSVGAPKRPNEGIAAGPLIRFLEAACKAAKNRIF